MNSIDNCNIIKCHGYFSKKDKLYIIMEYADDGKYLKILLKKFLSTGDLEKLVKEAKKTQTPISEKTVSPNF